MVQSEPMSLDTLHVENQLQRNIWHAHRCSKDNNDLRQVIVDYYRILWICATGEATTMPFPGDNR